MVFVWYMCGVCVVFSYFCTFHVQFGMLPDIQLTKCFLCIEGELYIGGNFQLAHATRILIDSSCRPNYTCGRIIN